MLKRSPRSRISHIIFIAACVIAAYIALDAVISLRSLSRQYGPRHTYFQALRTIEQGELISADDFIKHTMFSRDAPQRALQNSHTLDNSFAQSTIASGAILTKDMVSSSAVSSFDETSRIMFVPTNDVLSADLSRTTDLLSVSPDGYGAQYLARDATILFDFSSSESDEQSEHGYFVNITQDEAEDITQALSQGDVRFALRSKNH